MAFLNTYGNALYGRSFRLLDNTYTGPCCRLERMDTNAQIAIYFSGGYFDEAAYLTWASGATEVRCIKLYDQVGSQDLSISSAFAPFVRKDGVDVRDSFGRINLGFLEFLYFGFPYTPYFRNTSGTDPFANDRSLLFMISKLRFPSGAIRSKPYYWRETTSGNTIALQFASNSTPKNLTVRTIGTSSAFKVFTDAVWDENSDSYQAYNINSLADGATTDHFIDETPPDGSSAVFNNFNLNEERVGHPSSSYKVEFIGSEFIVWDEKKSNTDINNASADAREFWNTYSIGSDDITTSPSDVENASVTVLFTAETNPVTNSQSVVSDANAKVFFFIETLGAINNKAIVSNADIQTGAEVGTRVGLSRFTSLLGREWSIEIHDLQSIFAVSVPNFEVRGDGFTLNYESPNDNYLDIIKGSKLSFTPIIDQSDTTMQTIISDMGQSQDGRFLVRVYEDSDIYWFGQVQTSLIREPDTYPTQVKITSVDGLALLKDIDYSPSGNSTADGIPINLGRFTEVIAECLSQIKAYNTFFSGSDTPIKVSQNWYNDEMVSKDNAPLFTSAVERYLFKKTEQTDAWEYSPMSCYEVLKAVLSAWNSRIMLTKGQFVVEQVSTYSNLLRREWDVTVNGSTTSTVSSVNNTRTIDQTNTIRLAGGSRSWQKAVKSVNRVYEHNSYGNLLVNRGDYTTLTDWNDSGIALAVDGGGAKTLKIRIPINVTLFNRTGTTYNLQGQYVLMALFIKLQGPTDTIYLQKNMWAGVNTAQWDTSPDVWAVSVELPGPLNDGEFKTVQKVVEFETPIFTNDDYVTQEIRLTFPATPQLYSSWGSSAYSVPALNFIDYTDNQYSPSYSGDLLMWYTTGLSSIVLVGGDEQPSNEQEFESVNSSSDAIQTVEMDNTIIGSLFRTEAELGAVRVFDGSNWVVPANGWGYDKLNGNQGLTQISVNEALRLQEDTRSRQNFEIQGTIDAINSLSYKSDKYVFMGGGFVANLDRWTGEWLEIPSTIVLTGYNEILTTLGIPGSFNQGSGVTTQNELAGQVAGILQNGSITGVSSGIASGTDINGIDIEDFLKSNVINEGDEITVISATTGQSQTFTVSSDVLSGDTTISVDLATTEFEILPGDLITISSTQLAQNANSKTTEEGTFTPIPYLSSGTLTVVPSGTNGYYTVIGDLVFIRLRVQVNSVSSPFGDVFITNLPYNGDGTTNSFQSTIFNTISGDYVWGGFLVGNTIELYGLNTSQQASQDLQNATVITISGFYKKA